MTEKALEAALPGEAGVIWASTSAMRVLKDHYPQVEVLPAHLHPADQHTFGLVTLASLQAMQARAEKAERERDEAQASLKVVQNAAKTLASCQGTELEHLRQNANYDHRLRAEHQSLMDRDAQMTDALLAAEARVKELEEALKLAKDTIKVWHGPNAWDIYDRASPEMSAINTALKGGSNG